jgi:hypothetical protein
MENNLDNKARFFASNLGTTVHVLRTGIVEHIGTLTGLQQNGNDWYIQYKPNGSGSLCLASIEYCNLTLKPLSSITDEDLKGLFSLVGVLYVNGVPYTEFIPVEKLRSFILMPTFVPRVDMGDYLRSKGYALPFMGLSVEKMIEYNWIKLTL